MPIVFVHGVATRDSSSYQAEVRQRNALFERLVLPNARIFDPYWGSGAVRFDAKMPWLPVPGRTEKFNFGKPAAASSSLSTIAAKNPEDAIDAAFSTALMKRAEQGADALSADELKAFEAAVMYLERGADAAAFDPNGSDDAFVEALAHEIGVAGDAGGARLEKMGWGRNVLSAIVAPMKAVGQSLANVTSDAALRMVRQPMSEKISVFLGDVLVYLRWRNTVGAVGTAERIFQPIADDLVAAARLRTDADPLIVVGHSLGGVILLDLLADAAQLGAMERQLGQRLRVDALVTVGSQPGLFAGLGLYEVNRQPQPALPLRRPDPVSHWLNIFDYTDILSFRCEPLFHDVQDFDFDNVAGLLSAHSAYFQRPGFYSRLRKRLKELRVLA